MTTKTENIDFDRNNTNEQDKAKTLEREKTDL